MCVVYMHICSIHRHYHISPESEVRISLPFLFVPAFRNHIVSLLCLATDAITTATNGRKTIHKRVQTLRFFPTALPDAYSPLRRYRATYPWW